MISLSIYFKLGCYWADLLACTAPVVKEIEKSNVIQHILSSKYLVQTIRGAESRI